MIDLDASFHPKEADQTPATVFRYSAIGPRARTGRKERAPMSRTVPSTRIPNVTAVTRTAVTLGPR